MSVVGEKEMKEVHVHEWRGPQWARLRRKFIFLLLLLFGVLVVFLFC